MANKVLRLSGGGLVNFQIETADGLVLCPSDPNDSNFMIDDDEGKLWAIDFGRTCFLPPSFVSYSLTSSSDVFVQSVAYRVNYPRSAILQAMRAAPGRLVIFNDNTFGKYLTVINPGSLHGITHTPHRCCYHAASVCPYRALRWADFIGGVRTCAAVSVRTTEKTFLHLHALNGILVPNPLGPVYSDPRLAILVPPLVCGGCFAMRF